MSKAKFSVTFKKKIKPFKKNIEVDPDKSLSIRSILLASISEGISEITNLLESEDVYSSIYFVKKFGIKLKKIKKGNYVIYGKGLGNFSAPKNTVVDLGNSGTLCRLGSGLLATNHGLNLTLKGDKSLQKRNFKELFNILSKFGAKFYPKNKFKLPIKISSSDLPTGVHFIEKKGSAQMVSAVLFAGLNTFGEKTKILQKKESRDHTQIFLKNIGADLKSKKTRIGKEIEITGSQELSSFKTNIPGDPSSAAFFTALAILRKNCFLKIKNVGLNPTRIGFYEILKKHGANIKIKNRKKIKNEIIGDIIVRSSKIRPIKSSAKYYSKTVDEFPILFVIAALNKGLSHFSGIKDLANKESNRILEMKSLLNKINIKCKSNKNNMIINGLTNLNINKKKILIDPKLDHRICQSAAILALVTGANITIKNFNTVNTSAPSFLERIKQIGGKFEIKKSR